MIRRLRALALRVIGLFHPERADKDFEEELESHLRLHIDDNVRSGMTFDEARRDALIKLGGIAQARERYRDRHGLPGIDAAWQDLLHAVRVLLKRPALLIATTLSIGIAAGVNIGAHAVLHRVLFENLITAAAPDRIVRISPGLSYLNYMDLRASDIPVTLATMTMTRLTWQGSASTETISAHVVSDNFFDVIGIPPLMGQAFHTGDFKPGDGVDRAVVTFGFWQQRLGGDPSIIGKTIRLNDEPYVVAAVLPNDFRSMALASPNVYVPTTARVAAALNNRKAGYFDVIGRLHGNTTRDQATAALRVAAASLEARFPDENKELARPLHTVPATGFNILNEVFPAAVVPVLAGVAYGLVGLVLLIACANVTGLLVARAEERRHETAIRIALGASRGRLAQQFLAEGFVIALSGCACGAALWQWTASFIRANPAVINMGISAVPGSLPAAYCVALTFGVTLLCGLVPMRTARQVTLTPGLHARMDSSQGRRFTLRRVLVSGQVAICFVLLSAAAVLLLTFFRVRMEAPGFDTVRTISISVRLPRANPNDFFALRDALSSAPAVEAISCDEGFAPPVTFFQHIRKADEPGDAELLTDIARVGPRYFETLRIPIERGRDFNDADFVRGLDGKVAVINQTLARRYFGGRDPLGQRLTIPGNPETGRPARTVEIVGIAQDNKATSPNGDSIPFLYSPQLSTSMLVRVAAPPMGMLRSMEDVINRQLPGATVSATLMSDRLAQALMPMRVAALLISALGAAAVVLAMTGLYGVISYVSKRRSFEIGVRIALGATRAAVMRLILFEALLTVGFGCLAGGAAGIIVSRAIRMILAIQYHSLDAVAFAAVLVLLLITGLAASLSPARRAAGIDPIVAIRCE